MNQAEIKTTAFETGFKALVTSKIRHFTNRVRECFALLADARGSVGHPPAGLGMGNFDTFSQPDPLSIYFKQTTESVPPAPSDPTESH